MKHLIVTGLVTSVLKFVFLVKYGMDKLRGREPGDLEGAWRVLDAARQASVDDDRLRAEVPGDHEPAPVIPMRPTEQPS